MAQCTQCGKSPAKFQFGSDTVCAVDYMKFAHRENMLKIVQEEIDALDTGTTRFQFTERANIDGKGAFLLTGADATFVSDSLDEVLVMAEKWAGVSDPPF